MTENQMLYSLFSVLYYTIFILIITIYFYRFLPLSDLNNPTLVTLNKTKQRKNFKEDNKNNKS